MAGMSLILRFTFSKVIHWPIMVFLESLKRYKLQLLGLVNVASIGGVIQFQYFDQSCIVFGSLVSEPEKDCNWTGPRLQKTIFEM